MTNTVPKNESETAEFKTSFGDEVIISLTAFANTKGGTVFVGVDDKGKIKGIVLGKETLPNRTNEIKIKTQPAIIPTIEAHTQKNKQFVSIHVQEFPGKLHHSLTISDLKTNSYSAYARNKLISEAFYLTGDIEKYGSGFMRIRKLLESYPTMKMDYKETGAGFMVTVSYTKQKTSTVPSEKNGGVNEGLKSLLSVIEQNPGIQAKKISEFLDNRSIKTVERQVSQLIGNGLLERKGSRKTGGYFIIEK